MSTPLAGRLGACFYKVMHVVRGVTHNYDGEDMTKRVCESQSSRYG
jgi:hypothetical protein